MWGAGEIVRMDREGQLYDGMAQNQYPHYCASEAAPGTMEGTFSTFSGRIIKNNWHAGRGQEQAVRNNRQPQESNLQGSPSPLFYYLKNASRANRGSDH